MFFFFIISIYILQIVVFATTHKLMFTAYLFVFLLLRLMGKIL